MKDLTLYTSFCEFLFLLCSDLYTKFTTARSFPPPSPTTSGHLSLLLKSFRSSLPPFPPQTISPSFARRAVIISYNADRGTTELRHYIVKVKPYVSRRIRILKALLIPLNFGKEKDVEDPTPRKKGELGCGRGCGCGQFGQ